MFAGIFFFFWPLPCRELKAVLNPCQGTSSCLGFAELQYHSLLQKTEVRLHERYLPINISWTLWNFAHMTGKGMKILVSNGDNYLNKLSIYSAFNSKRDLCLNSSCHCRGRLIYCGKRTTLCSVYWPVNKNGIPLANNRAFSKLGSTF